MDEAGDLFIAEIANHEVAQVTAGVPVTVSPATPTVSVNPVNITYGTAPANGQLSGTATWSVKGKPTGHAPQRHQAQPNENDGAAAASRSRDPPRSKVERSPFRTAKSPSPSIAR